MKGFSDDVVVTCDENEDTPKNVAVNPSDEISYRFIALLLFC